MKYFDEFISFEIPENFAKGKVKVLAPEKWQIECRNMLFSMGVPRGIRRPTPSDVYEECKKIEERNMQTISPIPNLHNPFVKEGFYAYNQRITPNKKIHYYMSGALLCEDTVITVYSVGLIKLTEAMSIDAIMPTINSLTFNVEKYKESVSLFEKKMEKRFKKAARDGTHGVFFDFIQPFENAKMTFSPGSVLFENQHMKIQVFDLSGLGRETDMDLFAERSQTDSHTSDTVSISLSRQKKCMVQNMNGATLDIHSCRHISIMLAFQGNCYSIVIQSNSNFDLNDFICFLKSIKPKIRV